MIGVRTTAGEARSSDARSCQHDQALPNELSADLPNPRVAGIRDVSEASAADVPARIQELRMVEYIEEFSANLESF